jgi:hypothetical protein
MKRLRMLADQAVDGLNYKANQVVDLPDRLAAELLRSDPEAGRTPSADADPASIAYCLNSLKAEPITHEDAAARAASEDVVKCQAVLDDANAAIEAETDAGRRSELKKTAKTAADALREVKAKAKAAT